jgi:hypothetical protein
VAGLGAQSVADMKNTFFVTKEWVMPIVWGAVVLFAGMGVALMSRGEMLGVLVVFCSMTGFRAYVLSREL